MKKVGEIKILPSKDVENSYISIGFECLDREVFDPNKCYDYLEKSGIKYARVQTGWNKCEQTKGIIDFTWLDKIIDNLISQGVKPWFNVGYGNPLYMEDTTTPTCVGCVPLYYGEECYNAWLNFIRKLTEHYKGKIEHYEIWNESDLNGFWYPNKPNGTEYARLISITGKEIKNVDKNAKIGCCLCDGNAKYLSDLASGLKVGELDFYALHYYSRVPERYFPIKYRLAKDIFSSYGHNIEYWVSECGYPSWTYPNHFMHFRKDDGKGNYCSERQQAVGQMRYIFMMIASNIKRISYFQMVDMWDKVYQTADSTQKKPAAQGILNGITYTPKHAYYTLSRLANIFTADVKPIKNYMNCWFNASPLEEVSLKEYAFKKGDESMYAYYLPTDIEEELDIKEKCNIDISYVGECTPLIHPVLVDLYNGEIYEIEKFDASEHGISLYDLPIKDYPLIVCNKNLITK